MGKKFMLERVFTNIKNSIICEDLKHEMATLFSENYKTVNATQLLVDENLLEKSREKVENIIDL